MREETGRILLEAAAAGASLDDLAAIAACAIETWRAPRSGERPARRGEEDYRMLLSPLFGRNNIR